MKIRLFILFVSSLALASCETEEATPVTIACIPTALQQDVLAFYPFSNGSLVDESGNGLTLSNGTSAIPTTDRNGNTACAFLFDNSGTQAGSSVLSRSDANFLNDLPAFSISLWYQALDTSRNEGNYEVLLGRGDGVRCPDRNGEWSVGLYDCRRAVFGHDNSVWAEPISTPFINCTDEMIAQTDIWQHVVAIKDGDSYQLYVNGVLNATVSGDAACSTLMAAQDIGSLLIGKEFTGKIDDITLFGRALDSPEVLSVFEIEPCCE